MGLRVIVAVCSSEMFSYDCTGGAAACLLCACNLVLWLGKIGRDAALLLARRGRCRRRRGGRCRSRGGRRGSGRSRGGRRGRGRSRRGGSGQRGSRRCGSRRLLLLLLLLLLALGRRRLHKEQGKLYF